MIPTLDFNFFTKKTMLQQKWKTQSPPQKKIFPKIQGDVISLCISVF